MRSNQEQKMENSSERNKMSIVRFRYKIGENVLILALDLYGKIFARCDRGNYHEYRVIYWSDGKRNDEWLLESELEA